MTGKVIDFVGASTEFASTAGQRVAFRRLGAGEPLVLLSRFRATLEDWDPALINALASRRTVVVFDSLGVGQTAGTTPSTLEGAADFAVAFANAIGIEKADVMGWSMGGMTGQVLGLKHPKFCRSLILAGTLPPGGSPEVIPSSPEWSQTAGKSIYAQDDILYLFFTASENSRNAGRASIDRIGKVKGHDGWRVGTTEASTGAQLQAIIAHYNNEAGVYARLRELSMPVLVANGDRDGAFPAIDSVVLAREIPNSQLAIYQDSGHGFLFQHVDRFAADVDTFLSSVRRAG